MCSSDLLEQQQRESLSLLHHHHQQQMHQAMNASDPHSHNHNGGIPGIPNSSANSTNPGNPFPVFGYSSIFLPNFPCGLGSPPNHIIRVPAHRPLTNFPLYGQSTLGHPSLSELNASPLFSNFDPRSSLLLKDRLNGMRF